MTIGSADRSGTTGSPGATPMSDPSILPVTGRDDVLPAYRGTAIEDLLAYHNLEAPPRDYEAAELVIAMCMDNRKRLRLPDRFAFVVRTAGVYLQGLEFQLSFAIAIGGVGAIALIGHDDCGMSRLTGLEEQFVDGLVEHAGWTREAARRHYEDSVEPFAIDDPVRSTARQARQLTDRYPGVVVAPLLYRVGNGLLYQIDAKARV